LLVRLVAFLLHCDDVVGGGHHFILELHLLGQDSVVLFSEGSAVVVEACDVNLLLVAEGLQLVLLRVVCLLLLIELMLEVCLQLIDHLVQV